MVKVLDHHAITSIAEMHQGLAFKKPSLLQRTHQAQLPRFHNHSLLDFNLSVRFRGSASLKKLRKSANLLTEMLSKRSRSNSPDIWVF